MPPSDNDTLPTTLAAQAALADIRTRILAGERVSPADMRSMLDDLRKDRDATSRAQAKAKREIAKANKPPLAAGDILNTLFPGAKS